MAKLADLTSAEVEKFASRKGVKRVAVENFLHSVTGNSTDSIATSNLWLDAGLYKWNDATQKAILDGINYSANKEVSK
jgi:hypothetical protein